jgi:hypothetical protein
VSQGIIGVVNPARLVKPMDDGCIGLLSQISACATDFRSQVSLQVIQHHLVNAVTAIASPYPAIVIEIKIF